jgi:soluble lytic murein transglycosylase
MTPMRKIVTGFSLVVCFGCSTKHPPKLFEPYYSTRPESHYSAKLVHEIRDLELRSEISRLEKKRLFELYALEKSASRSEERKASLKTKMDEMLPKVSDLDPELRALQEEMNGWRLEERPKEEVFSSDPELKKRYSEILGLWNRDQNEEALQAARKLINLLGENPERFSALRIYYLYFRILMEVGDTESARSSYEKILQINPCATEAVQSALLLSLHHFMAQNMEKSRQLWIDQCEREQTPAAVQRRSYWFARFALSKEQQKQDLNALEGFYDYYFILSRHINNMPIELSPSDPNPRPYLAEPISVSRRVDRLLTSAEDHLHASLRKDASIYLTRASQLLREKDDQNRVGAALYTARLLQAAGNHLEAMKLFNWACGLPNSKNSELLTHPDVLKEMYPRPFQHIVEWNAESWKIDPDFLYALMRQESAFNPAAVSTSDARGLMQLMPFLARHLSKQWRYESYFQSRHLLNAEDNIRLAAFHVRQLRDILPHPALVAAAYNAGITRVTSWWKKFGHHPVDVFIELIPITETRNYVKYVLRNFVMYKALASTDGKAVPSAVFSLDLPPPPPGNFNHKG